MKQQRQAVILVALKIIGTVAIGNRQFGSS